MLLLDGHASEVWGLSVSRDGSSVASCGRDRSLRLWGRTDEPVFLEEEREKELEAAKGGSSGVGAADLGKHYEQNSGFGGAAAAAPPMGGDDDDFDFEGEDGQGEKRLDIREASIFVYGGAVRSVLYRSFFMSP